MVSSKKQGRWIDSSCHLAQNAVVITSPPYFHPEQAAAAVDAGIHVYLAKPVAVDVLGTLSIEASSKMATANKLVFLVDFQTRSRPFYLA